jgi:hypothetical protein
MSGDDDLGAEPDGPARPCDAAEMLTAAMAGFL